MSFSSDVKHELCRAELADKDKKTSQLYGMLLFCGRFSSREIIFKTENSEAAMLFEELITELFGVIVEKKTDLNPSRGKRSLCRVSVPLADDCRRIYESFGHSVRDVKLRINRANLGYDNNYSDFLRGAFLAAGSVTDPGKGYHLELSVRHKTLADNLIHLMSEVEVVLLKPKLVGRKGGFVVYLKGSDSICDFLGYVGAGNAVMRVIETSAYKDVINRVNRQQNSELANIRKISDAAARQTHAIRKIFSAKGADSLPPELRALAQLRLENPDMSLKELGSALTPPISRSGVNHRIERLLKIADEIQEEV